MNNDYFKHKAHSYEKTKSRVENVDNIANVILEKINFKDTMSIMDFGSGTGLLLERIAPFVRKVTAVDVSESMNSQLKLKQKSLPCELDILPIDLSKTQLSLQFDGIISSMTMHHIKDIKSMFFKFYSMMKNDSFLAIADLETEDGNFHTEDTGVFHFGFDRDLISRIASEVGFKNVLTFSASVINKPQGNYSVFLLTATK